MSIVVAPALLGDLLSIEVPGVVHHESKVLIIIDGGRDVVVVLFELFLGNDVVRSSLLSAVVSSFEGLEELLENLLLSLLTSQNIWMLIGSVDSTDVINVDLARSVLVKGFEGLGNNSLTSSRHWSTDNSEELVIFDEARSVNIEMSEELADLTLRESKHIVLHGLAEFKFIKGH